jgi:hypothetical protein
MGAWGAGSFDNDDAHDWVYELEESGVDAIHSALAEVIDGGGYVEAPECSMAIAAAEVVAAVLGRPTRAALPEGARSFLATRPPVDLDLADRARAAIDRVLAPDSELRDLWEESDSFATWKRGLVELRSRLSG